MVPKPSQTELFPVSSLLNTGAMGDSDTTMYSFLTMAMVEHSLK